MNPLETQLLHVVLKNVPPAEGLSADEYKHKVLAQVDATTHINGNIFGIHYHIPVGHDIVKALDHFLRAQSADHLLKWAREANGMA